MMKDHSRDRQRRFQAIVAALLIALSQIIAADSPGDTLLRQDAGGLVLTLKPSETGVQLVSLMDAGEKHEFLATNLAPLFTLVLRQVGGKQEKRLTAAEGWLSASVEQTKEGIDVTWEDPADKELAGISVSATARPDQRQSAWRWQIRVDCENQQWGAWRLVFPDLKLASLGREASVLFPRGPGEVQTGAWNRPFTYRGNYPGGWCSMQFMAAYRDKEKPTGLYLAVHDPWGSTKDMAIESDPATESLRLRYDHPVPDMGCASNLFVLSGEAVWRLLRGDWYDAALIYREWARKEARWWPRLGAGGRKDTPLWMRQLNAWALGGGASSECVAKVSEFRRFLGVPTGFHWYNWHEIPFDNDYPHYFPAKDGFLHGVRELKDSGVFVMPYINGRLWDSRDRGADDYQFTRVAWRATSKNPEGDPYLESYGSKETNGQPVRLAAMCPTTPLWQQTVRDIVLRLQKEAGVNAVYIDQVAAAAPALCMDRSHPHMLGGGHWWTEGYWQMLDRIRRDMPRDAALTTECNGEPFVRWFDGYLTWHWQHDGQVPVFPAVYGGTIQMFGRAYRGGATKDLALRMKAAQQLVFGEQIGWIDPGVLAEKDNAEFLRQVVQLRASLSRYFYEGEMARPLRLDPAPPIVRADWQWSGEWWVSTSAVLTGAWRLPQEHKLVLLFANASDQSMKAACRFSLAEYGIKAKSVSMSQLAPQPGKGPLSMNGPSFPVELELPARQAGAVELSW